MPLILILRFLFGLASILILGAAAHLLWRWYDGYLVYDDQGVVRRIREAWPLWVGLGALGWSFLGGLALKPFLAGRDKRVLTLRPSEGGTIKSPSGSTLHLEMHGDDTAPTIILTHGWGLDSSIWAYAVDDLKARFRVITWDLPGLGQSRGKIDLNSFAVDLRAVVEVAGTRPVVLVGHSIGGMTIQTLVRDHASFVEQRVAGIVLLNTTYTNPLRTMILSRLCLALRWPVIEPMMWLSIALSRWSGFQRGRATLGGRRISPTGWASESTLAELNSTPLPF